MATPGASIRQDLKLVAMVTARFSSERLQGKVIRLLHDRPLLEHILDRLRSVDRLNEIVIATSTEPSDDAVAALAEKAGVVCWRGPLTDVLGRVWGAAAARNADAVVRISGDSPLIDPALIRRAIDLFLESRPDIVTNIFPRSFPKGQSVEVMSRGALDRLERAAQRADEREHVTSYAYAHSEAFIISNFSALKPRPELRLSVDTMADYERIIALMARCPRARGFPSVETLIALADALARLP
jgi:spore coat polysaccharide biosynthesis protein SpsF